MTVDSSAKQESLWETSRDPTLSLPVPLPSPPLERGEPDHPILVGTSGFSFDDWTGPFYPRGTSASDRLRFYARYFPVVEVNSSYYRIPPPTVFRSLVEKTPERFEFIVKAHQSMTHEDSTDSETHRAFHRAIEPLRESDRLHGVLAQFPWRFRQSKAGRARLVELRHAFAGLPFFVEFRHDSWSKPEVFRFLEEQGIGYCCVDEPPLPGLVPPIARRTSEMGYVRFHGRNQKTWWGRDGGDRYDYDYSQKELEEWLGRIRDLAEKAEKTYVFFNNCHAGQAARNARLMMDLLQGEGS